jgi:catechol 2,3-dioxygenase-like lactoylglutathione lyase family enzyme
MKIEQVFHLTPLVHDLEKAIERYTAIFAPHIWYRGYERHVNNREAALMAIGDYVIEPMLPHAPFDDRPPTSHFRYLDRFGDGIHSLAVYATGLPEIRERLEAAGVRATDGGMETTIFTHPKDFPGLIEFFDASLGPGHSDANPRRHPDFSAAYWRELHPLRMQFASHATLVVEDHEAAAARYTEVLGCPQLPQQSARTLGAESSFVMFGSDTAIELAQPQTPESALADTLARVGQSWTGATFVVADLSAAEEFLTAEHIDAPIENDGHTIRIDREWMFGVDYAFTDTPLTGDPRAQ